MTHVSRLLKACKALQSAFDDQDKNVPLIRHEKDNESIIATSAGIVLGSSSSTSSENDAERIIMIDTSDKQFLIKFVTAVWSQDTNFDLQIVDVVETDSQVQCTQVGAAITLMLSIPERLSRFSSVLPDACAFETSDAAFKFHCCVLSLFGLRVLQNSADDAEFVWECAVQIAVRRGLMPCLARSLHLNCSGLVERVELIERLSLLTVHCLAKSSGGRVLERFVVCVLCDDAFPAQNCIFAKIFASLALRHEVPCCPRTDEEHKKQGSEDGTTSATSVIALQQAVFNGAVSVAMSTPLSRDVLRCLLQECLSIQSKNFCSTCVASVRRDSLRSVCKVWNSTTLTEDDVNRSTAVGHALTYHLLGFDDPISDKPSSTSDHSFVGDLLGGVSKRFDLLRFPSLRKDGARIALLYAQYVARQSETDSFPKFDEFPTAVEDWLKGEPDMSVDVASSVGVTETTAGGATSVQTLHPAPFVAVYYYLSQFPLDPDECCEVILDPQSAMQVDGKHKPGMSSSPSSRANDIKNDAPGRATDEVHILPFGKKAFSNNVTSSSNYNTLQEVYNAICVSKGQQSEADRLSESHAALRNLSTVLESLALIKDGSLPSDVSLLPEILVSALHVDCMDDIMKRLQKKAVTLCIVLSPRASLAAIDPLVNTNMISMSMQVELWRCISAAADYLSSRAVAANHADASSDAKRTAGGIYPPIQSSSAVGSVQRSTRTCEGTVRWKSKKLLGTTQLPVVHQNALVPHADVFLTVITSVVAKSDALQPFSDLEKLKCLHAVLDRLALSSHATRSWKPQVLHFLEAHLDHPTPEIRAFAWLALGALVQGIRGEAVVDAFWHHSLRQLASRSVDGDTAVYPCQMRVVVMIYDIVERC